MKFFKQFLQPAPVFFEEVKILPGLLIGAFITFFLFVFQPFGINSIENYKIHTLGYGAVTFVTYTIYHIFTYFIFKTGIIKKKKVTILVNIFSVVTLILLISVMNFFYSVIFFDFLPFSLSVFFGFLVVTFSIGIFPSVFFSYMAYAKELSRNQSAINQINEKSSIANTSASITFKSNVGSDEITLDSEQILAIKSQGNYIEVYFLNDKKTEKKMLRSTLKEVENILSDFQNFIKVHRSFIVNKNLIENSSGNSQGITLSFKNTDFTAPVSRNFVSNFK